jgi:hypothetical protein
MARRSPASDVERRVWARETSDDVEGLKAWIRECQVSWDVSPHFEVREEHRTAHGLELTLRACHRGHPSDPADEQSVRSYDRLVEIARRVVPASASVALEPFDSSFHLRPETAWQPETQLVVEILETGAAETAVRALRGVRAAVEAGLSALGVPRGQWPTSRALRGPTAA